MKNVSVNSPKLFLFNSLQLPIFLTASLYLFAFTLSGTNLYGKIDELIPYERVLTLIASGSCFALFLDKLKVVLTQYGEIRHAKL